MKISTDQSREDRNRGDCHEDRNLNFGSLASPGNYVDDSRIGSRCRAGDCFDSDRMDRNPNEIRR